MPKLNYLPSFANVPWSSKSNISIKSYPEKDILSPPPPLITPSSFKQLIHASSPFLDETFKGFSRLENSLGGNIKPSTRKSSGASELTKTSPREKSPFRTGTSTIGTIRSNGSTGKLSVDVQGLVKGMMKSSKLSHTQQRFLDEFIKESRHLPSQNQLSYTGNGSASPNIPSTKSVIKLNGTARPHLRSFDQIKSSGDLDLVDFKNELKVKKNRDIEKAKYIKFLENDGKLSEEDPRPVHAGRRTQTAQLNQDEGQEVDELMMLAQEISERREFLNDMIKMGQGEIYRVKIEGEIFQRLKRMETLTKKS